MASQSTPPHVLFFPFLAPGHLLPLAHVARLFALHSIKCTILTTPINEIVIRPIIDQTNETIYKIKSSRHLIPIVVSLIPFPVEAGLPVGIESAAAITSFEMQEKLIKGLFLLEKPFKQAMEKICPDAIVSDSFFPWSADVAACLGIPRFVFKGEGLLARCTGEMFLRCVNLLPADMGTVVIPGLPHSMAFRRMQMMDQVDRLVFALLKGNNEADQRSCGEIINSFFELESDYVGHWQNVIGRKAWLVGPLTLFGEHLMENSLIEEDTEVKYSHAKELLEWLDANHSRSVVYVCFGTLSQSSTAQLKQLALGIEAAGKRFVMVATKDLLQKELEEITKGGKIGMIIRGWAPQSLILNHEAVGGFVTHCGWNSTIEAITAGVPMITWPLFSDQFYNEKLIVEVLRVGVEVGVKDYGYDLEQKQLIQAETITRVIERVMGEGEEGKGMRQRSKELKEKAKKAVHVGGSSYVDLKNLIEELICKRNAKMDLAQGRVDV